MRSLLIICVLASLLAINAGQPPAGRPEFLSKYLTPAQLIVVTNQFKNGHKQVAISHLRRYVRRLPKEKQDEFNQDFRAWVEAKAVISDSPITADLSFLTMAQRESVNRKILNCDKLGAMRELREHIDKLPKGRRQNVLRAFRNTLPNLDFLTPQQWEAIQAKSAAGDENGAKALLADYIGRLPTDEQEKAVQELLKAQKSSTSDICALNADQRKHVLTKLSQGDKAAAKQALDSFTARNEASKKAAG